MLKRIGPLTRAMARSVRRIPYLAAWRKAGPAFHAEYRELEEEQGCIAMAPRWTTTSIPQLIHPDRVSQFPYFSLIFYIFYTILYAFIAYLIT